MSTVSVHEAKTHLSRLLERVLAGDDVIITRSGRPLARLVPMESAPKKRKLGSAAGLFTVPKDFDDPLPEDVLRDFGV